MKKQLFALVGLGLLLTAVSVSAQSLPIKVNVPFNFTANKVTMPAGEYTIEPIGTSSARALLFSGSSAHLRQIVLTLACESSTNVQQTKLVFHRYGDRYFLAQIWLQGDKIGQQLPKGKREAEVALDYPAQQVELVAQIH
jgi:hypothetical protein